MCELLGVSSARKIYANDLLKEFFSHSNFHPNGWGLAVFHGDAASIEKEPVRAVDSGYLKQRLRNRLEAKTLIAHIRLATLGSVEYENCHPFTGQDISGRKWTLAHNGTIFHGEMINRFFYEQNGSTDSERILYGLIDQINKKQRKLGRALDENERFAVIDHMVCALSKQNKLNLLIYDGEMMYVHTNYAHSLFISQTEDTTVLASKPVGRQNWEALSMNTLFSYCRGNLIRSGTTHGNEYMDNEEDMRFIYLDSASL